MGNVITTTINAWNRGGETPIPTQTPSLWDMVTFLLKKYVLSKIENDEFLCQYLLTNGSTGTIYNYGQRAITFEPLPSRVCPEEYDIKYSKPKVVDYSSTEGPTSESSEDLVINNISEESFEDENEEIDPSLAIYSAYGMMHFK